MAPTARAEGGSALPRQATDFEPLIGASKNHHERSLLCCDLDLAGPDHGPTLRPLLSPRVSTAVAAVALAAAGGGFFAAWLLLATFQPPLALEATTLGLKLVSATVLVRHGARSALQQQTWENFTWAEGYGELTTRGMAQGHALGVELRRRYVDELGLLPPSLLADGGHSGLVEAHSTEYDRTQETTWALLMGLFSPLDREAEPVACGCRPKSGSEHSRRVPLPLLVQGGGPALVPSSTCTATTLRA